MDKANLKETLLWLMGRRKRFRVQGHSMLPLLKPNDEVLMKTGTKISVGDIVVFQDPRDSLKRLIKQVESIKSKKVKVTGLNSSDSEDSRNFGSIGKDQILGKVTSVF